LHPWVLEHADYDGRADKQCVELGGGACETVVWEYLASAS